MNRAKNSGLSTHNACITRLLPCRLSPNLPLNTINQKKPRTPNVANRVDAFVKCLLTVYTKSTYLMRINGNIMRSQYNTQAIKKATNLTLNSDLLAEAKRLKINLSATMEKALSQEVSKLKRQEWLEQNSEAIDACNELTEKHGLFSDSYRVF